MSESSYHVPLGKLRAYEVVSAEYMTYGANDTDPPEYGCAYRLVFARTARRAKVLAVRAWRRDKRERRYFQEVECPFTGMKTFRADSRCFMRWE